MVFKAFPNCIAVPHKRSGGALEVITLSESLYICNLKTRNKSINSNSLANWQAVESSLADKAVLTIENASIGSFHQSYDLLLSHNLQIVQEVQMDVELCLLALPGVQKDDIQTIFSHPQVTLNWTLNFWWQLAVSVAHVGLYVDACLARLLHHLDLDDAFECFLAKYTRTCILYRKLPNR